MPILLRYNGKPSNWKTLLDYSTLQVGDIVILKNIINPYMKTKAIIEIILPNKRISNPRYNPFLAGLISFDYVPKREHPSCLN